MSQGAPDDRRAYARRHHTRPLYTAAVRSVPSLGIPGLENPEVVGEGGFGTVYKVDEPEFGRSVAVKVIQERLGDDSVKRAFLRECQAMGKLSGHPHIVTVLRGGTTEAGRPYIVMDLMSGGSLADRLAQDGPMPWPDVLEVAVTVAGALETAHRAGILHLDMKPANLLISKYGEPKLADFGISRLPGVTETTDGRVKASVAFAAPERLLDGTATVASDLYGLGATMFTLLTGKPAFTGDGQSDLLAIVARVVRDPIPDLRPRGVPDPVARVVERLMAKSPAERYGSAADAAVALQAAQRSSGRPVTKAVIEGERPSRGDTGTYPTPRSSDGVAPLRPLVPGFTGAAVTSGPNPPPPPWISQPYQNQPGQPYNPGQNPQPGHLSHPAPLVGQVPGTRQLHGQPPPPSQGWGPQSQPPPPPRRNNTALIAAVAAATVVVIAIVATAIYLSDGDAQGQANPPLPTRSGTPTTSYVAPPQTTIVVPPDDVVAVVDGVRHPATIDARATLRGLYTGINESRYEDAFAYYSTDSDIYLGGIAVWQEGQSTTIIDTPVITAVRDTGPNTIEVDVTFTSYQSPEYSPDGTQGCTDWQLSYDMVGPGPSWKIRGASELAPAVAC